MSSVPLIEYQDASREVREIYDDIMATRGVSWVNNFWKALANHPPTLRRCWGNVKEALQPGALDALTKEMIYVAVSVASGCEYCIRSHTAAARRQGMSDAMLGELMGVVATAAQTNRLAEGYRVPVDAAFVPEFKTRAELREEDAP